MKKLYRICLVMLCGIMFIGCGASKLSSNYSEDKLKKASEEIIANLNDEKYDQIVEKGNDKFKKALPGDKIKTAWEKLNKNIGKYDSISKIVYQESDGVAIVVANAKYEKGNVQFTLSYDKDMKLVGIFVK